MNLALCMQVSVCSPAKRAIWKPQLLLVLLISMILILCEEVAGRDLKYFKITKIVCFELVIKATFQ